MRRMYFILVGIIFIVMLFIMNDGVFKKKRETNVLLLPSLPRPIAKEDVLITSAGQSTDAYIINDVANKLMIHNYFMPQAAEMDLEGVNTLVFVVGYSSLGGKINNLDFDDEKKRIAGLLDKAEKENLSIITLYIGGKQRRRKETDELIRIIGSRTDYLIATREANSDNFLSELSKTDKIPLTLVSEISDVSEPFASAFR